MVSTWEEESSHITRGTFTQGVALKFSLQGQP
jgi:hypothetical protein